MLYFLLLLALPAARWAWGAAAKARFQRQDRLWLARLKAPENAGLLSPTPREKAAAAHYARGTDHILRALKAGTPEDMVDEYCVPIDTSGRAAYLWDEEKIRRLLSLNEPAFAEFRMGRTMPVAGTQDTGSFDDPNDSLAAKWKGKELDFPIMGYPLEVLGLKATFELERGDPLEGIETLRDYLTFVSTRPPAWMFEEGIGLEWSPQWDCYANLTSIITDSAPGLKMNWHDPRLGSAIRTLTGELLDDGMRMMFLQEMAKELFDRLAWVNSPYEMPFEHAHQHGDFAKAAEFFTGNGWKYPVTLQWLRWAKPHLNWAGPFIEQAVDMPVFLADASRPLEDLGEAWVRLAEDPAVLENPAMLAPSNGASSIEESGLKALARTPAGGSDPISSWLVEAVAECRMYRRLAAVRLALLLFEHEQGRPARTLEELVPNYLPGVPIDPKDPAGGAIRARLEDPKPRIYSRGSDGTDEGGHDEHDQVFYLRPADAYAEP